MDVCDTFKVDLLEEQKDLEWQMVHQILLVQHRRRLGDQRVK